jgi:hypothetical protein
MRRQRGGNCRGEKVQVGQDMVADGHVHPRSPGQRFAGEQKQKKKR